MVGESTGDLIQPKIEGGRQPEPGVVRSDDKWWTHRILDTGWPTISKKAYPQAYNELGRSVALQVKREMNLRKYAKRDVFGAYRQTNDAGIRFEKIVFNLNDRTLTEPLRNAIDQKMSEATNGWSENPSNLVEICDIGGGAGTLLGFAMMEYRDKWGTHKDFGRSLKTTMTTLVHHDKRAIEENYRHAIDEIRTMAIELPPDDFYHRFDIISAQNSVYYWSQHPELATLNIWKMLKGGGVALATIPPGEREIEREVGSNVWDYFDVEKYLRSCGLFEYQEIGKNEDGSVSVSLKKI